MQSVPQSDRLSWGDTVFLHLEREDMPLNVASVCIFEGDISFKDCLQFVESKLPLLPRYMKRVVAAPFGVGLPTWEYDPTFETKRHMREVRLRYGTDAELKALAGKLLSTVMDRRHPLWDMTIVHGLRGHRTAIVIRLHHCLTDGIAGVGLMNVLFDANAEIPPLPRHKVKFQPPPRGDAFSSLTTGVVESSADFVKRILSAMADVLSMAERVAANGGEAEANQFSALLPEMTAFTERLRFNVVYRGPQKFAYSSVPLKEVKAIRSKCGTSVNDVILALVTATIRRYCELHGDPVRGRLFRMMVPVNLRGNGDVSDLGNRISLIPVTVPLNIRHPRKLLLAVHKRTEFLKRVHAAELVSLAGGLLGMLPTPVQGLAGPIASQLPITPFNLVCTNVPGPQFPLYLLGHRMTDWYPYVPVGGEMAMNCAVLSYNGTIYFGFTGDVHAAPDLKRMEKLLQTSFAELREAVGLRPSHTTKTARKRRAVPAAAQTAESNITAASIRGPASSVPAKKQPEGGAKPLPVEMAREVVVA